MTLQECAQLAGWVGVWAGAVVGALFASAVSWLMLKFRQAMRELREQEP